MHTCAWSQWNPLEAKCLAAAQGDTVCVYAVFSSGVGGEVTLAVLTITTIPIVLEARKALEKDRGEKEGDKFRALPFL